MNGLRELRRTAGLSQQECAALICMPFNTFRMWDSGLRSIPSPMLRRAKEALAHHAHQNELLPLDRLASELGVHVCTLQAAAAHEDGVVFGKMPFSNCRKRGLGFYRWVPAC